MDYKRKVLVTNGMSNDAILFITDAPQKHIEEWLHHYSLELENGENTFLDYLKEEYYVRLLFDSELEINNDDIEIIGYDESYDLNLM